LEHAQDALAAVLEAYEDLGRPLPPELHPANTRRPVELETLLTV
jgi:predicted RNase H-like HicB family nuclease